MKCKWGVTWSGVTGSHRGSKKNKLEIYNNNLYGVACKSRVCETSLFLQKIFQKGNSFDREAKWWKNAGVFFFILFSSLENLWKYPAGSVCVCGGGGGLLKYIMLRWVMVSISSDEKEYFFVGKGSRLNVVLLTLELINRLFAWLTKWCYEKRLNLGL